jgi:PAS domain S-box-containing protein
LPRAQCKDVEKEFSTIEPDGASPPCAFKPVNRDQNPGPSDEGSPESDRLYRELFDTSRDGIAHLDMEGRFVDANPAFLGFVGYPSVESIRGLTFDAISPPEYFPEKRLASEQKSGHGYTLAQKEYIRKDGERFFARIGTWPRRNNLGTPIGTWVVALDIINRRSRPPG